MFKKQSKFVVEDIFHDKTELVLEIFQTATDILPTSVDLNSRLKQKSSARLSARIVPY